MQEHIDGEHHRERWSRALLVRQHVADHQPAAWFERAVGARDQLPVRIG